MHLIDPARHASIGRFASLKKQRDARCADAYIFNQRRQLQGGILPCCFISALLKRDKHMGSINNKNTRGAPTTKTGAA